jgi:hypothetical protein
MVFENTVLRKIFRPKRDDSSGYRRKVHNEELRRLTSLRYSGYQIREDEMGGAVKCVREKRNAHRLL